MGEEHGVGNVFQEVGQPRRAASSGACQGGPVLLTSYAQQWTASSCNLQGGVPLSMRSSPLTDGAAAARKSVGLVGACSADAGKAMSLSPHRESRRLKSDVPVSQHQGSCLLHAAGAAPLAMQAYCSPAQAHRALVSGTAAVAAALRLSAQSGGQRSGSFVTAAVANQDCSRRGGRWLGFGGSGRPSHPIAASWQPIVSSASLLR